MSNKITCDCGAVITKRGYKQHLLTKKHIKGAGLMDIIKSGVNMVKNVFSKPNTNKESVKSSILMPDTKTLYKMAEASYSTELHDIAPYKRILRTPYLTVYTNNHVLVLAVRGTDIKDSKDLIADVKISLGKLRESERYKKDVEIIKELKRNDELKNMYWVATGHSLGGALIDEFLKDGLISEAVTFNPAISKEFNNVNNKNRRIYMSNDPLYLLMGKHTKYHEVRERPDVSVMKSHSLQNFVGGKKLNC